MWFRAARAFLGASQAEIAEQAGISLKSLSDLETMLTVPHESTLRKIRGAYEARGVEFLIEDQRCIGIRSQLLEIRPTARSGRWARGEG